MEHDAPVEGDARTELVLLQSDRRPWRELVAGATATYRGKLLSELIVLIDNGPFSHVVFHRGESVLDARRPSSVGRCAVATSSFASLKELERDRSRFRARDRDLSPAWDAIVRQPWFRNPIDGAHPDLSDETNAFTYGGLVLVALNLATTEWRPLRPLGRFLLRRHHDDPGFFCSELVAKAMLDARLPLEVVVRPDRIPPAGSRTEEAVLDFLVERQQMVAFGAEPVIDTDDIREQYRAQLTALRDSVSSTGEKPVRVGYPGGPDPLMPPSLVTPNDLLRSPSFAFLSNDRADDGGSPTIAPPALSAAERRSRFVRYLGALALVPVNSILARLMVRPGPVDRRGRFTARGRHGDDRDSFR